MVKTMAESNKFDKVAYVTITNTFKATDDADAEKVYNTGLDALSDADGAATKDFKYAGDFYKLKHIASIRLYDGTGNANQYVYIKPNEAGDESITIETSSYKETAYYFDMKANLTDKDFVTIEISDTAPTTGE